MLFLVAICAMSAPYGIRNATATGTIATTHAFVTTSCSPVYCTNCSPSIMFQLSNALWVALCATDATYGIGNATAIETIAITLICYHIMPPAHCPSCSPLILNLLPGHEF